MTDLNRDLGLQYSNTKSRDIPSLIGFGTGWLGFCLAYNWPQFMFETYDPVLGCVPVDFSNPVFATIKIYSYVWIFLTYPVPLFFAIVFNAVAVFKLRAESRHLHATETKPSISDNVNASTTKSAGTDTQLKRRAALGLQRAAIALCTIFAFSAAPLQIILTIQSATGL